MMFFRRKGRGKRSLVQHLTASLIVVVALSSVAISSVIFVVLYEKSEAQFEQRANEALTHLSNSLESYLWHMEEESVVSLCQTFFNIDIVVYIQVDDHRGNEICRFGKIIPGETILKEEVVSYDHIDVGVVRLGLTQDIFKQKVFETTWISLLSLLSVVVVLGLFTRLVLDRTLRTPLGKLISRIEAISAGQYSKPTQEENFQEIQLILSKFNEMVEQVRLREQELRFSEEKYRRLFETSIEGIIMLDVDDRISMVNQVFADLLGYTEAELVGMPARSLIYEDELEDHDNEMDRRRAGQSSQYGRRFIRKDGGVMWGIISSSPQFGEKGEYQGSFSMVTDITDLRTAQAELKMAYDKMEQRVIERTDELNKTNRLLTSEIHIRKQTEKEIIKAKEAAEEATQAKSEFLANMSHEIRTPMNAIIGMTHLAKMTNLSATQKDYLNKIDISAKSLLGIINDVLDLSKIEAGMLTVESVGFKLDQVLEQLTTIISPRANEKKLEFLINVKQDVPPAIVGDSMRLAQILINLCNNAVKFTDSGSVIVSIENLEQKGHTAKLRFSVKDDGIGIEEKMSRDLFLPFTQADASTTRKYGGTGLGLSLCSQLVELMGGEIGVESELGKGSLFWFEITVPIYDEDNGDTLLPEELQGMTALVVDDNPTSRIILKGMLEHIGLSVDLAKSGQEALEILRNTPSEDGYKLLVIDWRMPDMDGLDTAAAILSDASIMPKPPMFMVSAYANANLVKKTNEMGFKGLLFKPVNQSFLFNLVVEILGKGLVTLGEASSDKNVSENLKGARILLVEDNEINRQVAQEILSSTGIDVYEAFNGQHALDFLEENEVDLVLMDIQMPVMDGYEATTRIRRQEKFKDLPIIAMTAHAMVADIEASQAVGMNGHIAKPFDPDDLFEVLNQWISGKSGEGPAMKAANPAEQSPDMLPSTMPGFDLELGLKRARGNVKLYRTLLLLLDEKYADAARNIEQALADGRRDEAIALAHSVKGTSGMLGGMDLFEAASNLEQALDEGEEAIDDLLAKFSSNLDTAIGGISVLKEVGGDETSLMQDGDVAAVEDLQSSLDGLKQPLSRGAPVECRERAAVVQSLVWPKELQADVSQVLKLIAEYDFKKALLLVAEIEKQLG